MASIDLEAIHAWVDEQWESHALGSLAEFIEIPALSPAFDEDWAAHGYLDDTIDLFLKWLGTLPMKGMSCNVHRIEGRTPVLTVTIEGSGDGEVSLQPSRQAATVHGLVGRQRPWIPVREDPGSMVEGVSTTGTVVTQHPLDFSSAATQYCPSQSHFLD